jgi:hypothetical protein
VRTTAFCVQEIDARTTAFGALKIGATYHSLVPPNHHFTLQVDFSQGPVMVPSGDPFKVLNSSELFSSR